MGVEQDELPCGPKGTPADKERDGNLHAEWATPWSAEEMLDGQHQRVDISAHTRTAHKGLLQKRLEEDFC